MIERYKQTKGEVVPCERIASNDKYREGQDYFLEFVKENIEPCEAAFAVIAIGPKFRFGSRTITAQVCQRARICGTLWRNGMADTRQDGTNIRFIEHNIDTVEAIQQEEKKTYGDANTKNLSR